VANTIRPSLTASSRSLSLSFIVLSTLDLALQTCCISTRNLKRMSTVDPNLLWRSRASITTSQMIALSYTYRLIFRVLFSIPLFLLLAQLTLMASFFVLDPITNQHTLITLFFAVVVAQTIGKHIIKSAPTDRQAMETRKKLQYSLPAVMLIPSIMFARAIITPLEGILRWKAIFTLIQPSISIATTMRLSLGSILLGCSMCARYVGPPSIGTHSLC
jgi:hypothetical protein